MNDQLVQEWMTLHNNHEAYERNALLIKLLAVVLAALTPLMGLNLVAVGLLLLALWCQEAILKTWQGRLSDRLLDIEQALKTDSQVTCAPFQLYSRWSIARPGLSGQAQVYAMSARRPTVAFPYVVLLLFLLLV